MGRYWSHFSRPAVAAAAHAVIVAALTRDAQAVSAQAQAKMQAANVSYPDPVPEHPMTIWVRPGSLLAHLREYLKQTGRLSTEVENVLNFPFVRQDRPLVVQSLWSNRGPSALAFSSAPDAKLPETLRGGMCRGGKDGLLLCASNQSAASTNQLEKSYSKPGLAHDLEASLPISGTDSLSDIQALRGDIPRTVQSIFARVPQLDVGFAATAMAETWLYDLHHDVLEASHQMQPVILEMDIEKDGSLKGKAASTLEVPPPWRDALQAAPLRSESPLIGLFPRRTKFTMSMDAKVLGQILLPSPRVAKFASEALSENDKSLADFIDRVNQVHQQCFHRSQELVAGWGNTNDFGAEKLKPSSPAKKSSNAAAGQDYWAIGIGDNDGKCAKAVAGLWALVGQKNDAKQASNPGAAPAKSGHTKSVGSEPVLALPAGVIVTKRIGEATWLIHAANQETSATVLAELTSGSRRPGPAPDPQRAAIVLRAGKFLNDSSMRSKGVSDRDVPIARTRVGIENGKLALSFEASRDTARHVLVNAIYQFVSNQQTRLNAELMHAACDLGSSDSCNGAGVAYLDWPEVKDRAKSKRLLEKACNDQHGLACANLGTLQSEQAPQQAQKAYARSCDLGTPLGCASLGNTLLNSSDAKDQKLATDKLRMACEDNVASACTNLGFQYFDGRGVPVDHDKGISYYERACGRDGGLACVLLGHVYLEGKGRERSAPKALELYAKGCELHEAVGCSFVGRLLIWGEGIERNQEVGRKFLGRACDQGHAESCRLLGDLAGGKP
jgi:uncharacterized protein